MSAECEKNSPKNILIPLTGKFEQSVCLPSKLSQKFEMALPNLHVGEQFIDPSGHGVRCVLCDTGLMMGKTTVNAHLAGWLHTTRMVSFQRSERVDVARRLHHNILLLGLPKWRMEVQAQILDYVQIDDTKVGDAVLTKAFKTLHKYEKMDRLSLLELAVWKASLTSDPFFESMDDLDAYWTLERNFDPIAYKHERHMTSGITVIIQNVLPFLE